VVENQEQRFSASGVPIKDIYTPEDAKDIDYDRDIGLPGQPPFTRGVYASMYRGQLWTIRRLTGFNTPEDTNKRYREEYELGQTGFSIAPDISTAVGMDPDDPRVSADVGHSGVPIYSVEDMEAVFDGLPIEKCSTYLADRVGGLLTPAYFLIAERRGISFNQVRGTTANDLCTWSSIDLANQPPPQGFLRYAVDLVEWCAEHAPRWYPVSFNSYNPRDNGINAVQEMGLLMATVIQYIEEAKRRGRVPLDKFVRRFAFNMAVNNDFFEEIAKLRAARRMLQKIIKERYGIDDPSCGQFRVHVQSSGSTHTHQEPLNNLIRIAYQVMAGVLGGAQSIHANGYDEAVCLPTDQAMLLAIRTEQIAALETNVTNTVDPLAGSYYVEWLTDRIEEEAMKYIDQIDTMGGMVEAVKRGFPQREIAHSAYQFQREIDEQKQIICGVNEFIDPDEKLEIPLLRVDTEIQRKQLERLRQLKEQRDPGKVERALTGLRKAAETNENTMPYIFDAVKVPCTLGEIINTLKIVYGEHKEQIIY